MRVVAPLVRGDRVTVEGQWSQVRNAATRPAPIRPDLPILIAAKGERMLRLAARFADAWQTAWFARPDDRFRQRHTAMIEACAAEGRDPATLQVTVGVSVEESADGASALPHDAGAIADALGAWREAGVDHVQLGIWPLTLGSLDVALEAIRAAKKVDPTSR